jgi:hypothetical protein
LTKEQFPVSEKLKVIEGTTLFKSNKWWSAVVLLESFGRKQVGIYLWHERDGDWKRRQKFVVGSIDNWAKIKETVEKYIPRLVVK